MLKLNFLGRGSSFNRKEGNNSAYIKDNKDLVLLDCGGTVFGKIQETGLLDGIETLHILITHNHSDHIGSLSAVIHYCYYVKKINVNVYTGENQDLHTILTLQSNCNKQFSFYNCFHNEELDINKNIHIMFFPVKHSKKISCNGIILRLEDTKVYFSGDTSEISEVLFKDIDNFKKIYHDTSLADYEGNGHTSLRKLTENIPLEYRNKFYCMHLDCDELIVKAKKLGFNVVEI